jgi:hypothetical protein
MVNPLVGAFAQGDARSGEVSIRATSTGPRTTVLVRQLDTDGSWWILGSTTPNIQVSVPVPRAQVSSPVTLRGRSTAFEATVNVSIREDDHPTALAESFVMGGANGTLGPFDTAMNFTHPTSPNGAIVFYTVSSESGHVTEATVIRVRY